MFCTCCLDGPCHCGARFYPKSNSFGIGERSKTVTISTAFVLGLGNDGWNVRDVSNKVKSENEDFVVIINEQRFAPYDGKSDTVKVEGSRYKELANDEVVVKDLNNAGLLKIVRIVGKFTKSKLKRIRRLKYFDRKEKCFKVIRYYEMENHRSDEVFGSEIFVFHNERYVKIYRVGMGLIWTKLSEGERLIESRGHLNYEITTWEECPF